MLSATASCLALNAKVRAIGMRTSPADGEGGLLRQELLGVASCCATGFALRPMINRAQPSLFTPDAGAGRPARPAGRG